MSKALRPDHQGFIFLRNIKVPQAAKHLVLQVRKQNDGYGDYYVSYAWLNELFDYCVGMKTRMFHDSLSGKPLKSLLDVNTLNGTDSVLRKAIESPDEKFDRHAETINEMFNFPLWSMQVKAANLMYVARQFYLADDVGLGKTFSTFAALTLLNVNKHIHRALILCPSSVKYQWKTEINHIVKKKYRDKYKVVVVDGSAKKREEQWLEYTENPNLLIHIVNYESFRADVEKLPKLYQKPEAIVFDEAWKVKNHDTQTHKAVKRYINGKDSIKHRYALNAAPIGNGYEDLFGVFDLIYPATFGWWRNFRATYLEYERKTVGRGNRKRTFQVISNYKSVPDLKRRVSSRMMRRTVRQTGLSQPEITISAYWVDLTKAQRKCYNDIKKMSFNMDDPLAQIVKARVACLKDPKGNVKKSPKYKELMRVLTEVVPHEKVIIFSEFRTYLEQLIEVLQKSNILTGIISGAQTAAEREVTRGNFVEGNTRVLLLTSAGEAGLNLQAADVIVNLDLPWNPERIRQRVGRLRPHLGGGDRLIKVINVLARDTIEERVVNKIRKKLGYFANLFDEQQEDLTGVFEAKGLIECL